MNTNMTGFRWFLKKLCVLVLGTTKVASALEGLTWVHCIAVGKSSRRWVCKVASERLEKPYCLVNPQWHFIALMSICLIQNT